MVCPGATVTTAFFQPERVPRVIPRRFGFAGTFETFTAIDVDLEDALDRLADLRLVRVGVHAERVLAALGDLAVALLGHDRGDQDWRVGRLSCLAPLEHLRARPW